MEVSYYKVIKDYDKNDFWGPLSSMALIQMETRQKSGLFECQTIKNFLPPILGELNALYYKFSRPGG